MATTSGGRPRDPSVDRAVLAATRQLLLDAGYAGTTIEAVAARAKVGKPTIYRRYPSKAALVLDTVFGRTKAHPDPDTGHLADDLREAYSWVVEEFAAPEARAAVPGLLADLAADPALRDQLDALVIGPEYARVLQMLRRGQERGELPSDLDEDALLLAVDTFTGAALTRLLLVDRPIDIAFGDRLVALIVAGLGGPSG